MARRAGGQTGAAEAVPACALATDVPRLEAALAQIAEEFGTDRRDICATRLIEVWAWVVAAPAAEALIAGEPIPDISPAATLISIEGPSAEWDATFTGHPVVGTDHELLAELRASLIAQLDPLVETLNSLARRPRRALWRGATDRLAGSFLWFGEQRGEGERSRSLARAAVDVAPLRGRARSEVIPLPGGGEERLQIRDGCCLYYRVPGGRRCASCPLVSDAERGESLAAELGLIAAS